MCVGGGGGGVEGGCETCSHLRLSSILDHGHITTYDTPVGMENDRP